MQSPDSLDSPKASENNPSGRNTVQLVIITAVVYLAALLSAMYWNDRPAILAILISLALLAIPIFLQRSGRALLSGYALVLLVFGTVTALATLGQGIHDVVIMGYPIVIIFASLALDRRGLYIAVALSLLATGWLGFGEAARWYSPRPSGVPNGVDFLVITSILLAAAASVNILAKGMRQSLDQAREEITQRMRVEAQLRHQSTHDGMTGIYNRNFFETELQRLEQGREFPISVIIADVDGLKSANDTLGHAVGDEKLRQTASLLHGVFRAGDILARIGGDEFAALLPNTTAESAAQIVARLREGLAAYNRAHPSLPVQLSIGSATATHGSLASVFTQADQNMYAEKSQHKAGAHYGQPATPA